MAKIYAQKGAPTMNRNFSSFFSSGTSKFQTNKLQSGYQFEIIRSKPATRPVPTIFHNVNTNFSRSKVVMRAKAEQFDETKDSILRDIQAYALEDNPESVEQRKAKQKELRAQQAQEFKEKQ